MSGKKKDNDYQWLQEELTRDVQMLDETKVRPKGTVQEKVITAEEKEHSILESENIAFTKEMKELQQALATEVSDHTTKRVKKDVPPFFEGMNNGVNKNEVIKRNQEYETGKLPVWAGILIAVVFLMISVGIVICGKSIGKTALITMGLLEGDFHGTVEDITQVPIPEVRVTEVPTATPEITQTVEEPDVKEDEVYNLLLLGIEDLENEKNADTIVVVSVNVTDKTYHVIQFMRDLYLEIPGYGMDRLSTAYKNGGGALVVQTISENFDLPMEGYVSVDLKNFVKIIDFMGGITIQLTKEEAEYLNTTNYISNKYNRTMVVGKQKVNGDQALGYCRIQWVPNADQLSNDFGRVARAKAVLQQLFQKVSNMSLSDLLYTLNESLSYIRTNLTKEKFKTILQIMSDLEVHSLDTMRVPIYTLYESESVNRHTVYVPAMEETLKEIQRFIYGEDESN